jgi:GTP-binding protein
VINKVDRPDRRVDEVLDEIFDLFVALDATNDQLDFPVLYASGRNGWATADHDNPGEDLQPLFQAIKRHVPPPSVDKHMTHMLDAF